MMKRFAMATLTIIALTVGVLADLDTRDRSQPSEAVPSRIGHLDINGERLRSLSMGDIITSDVPTRNIKELAACAALVVDAEPDSIVKGLRQLSFFSQNQQTTVVGFFSETPEAGDLDALTLD